MNLLLATMAASLFTVGTYLVIQRKLSRIIIGISLLTHGANVLFLMSGRRGNAPLIGNGPMDGFSDPLPQAMMLTAIVISFGVTAFLLALAYRSWILTADDEVEDDVTDRLVARGGFKDQEISDSEFDDTSDHDDSADEDAAEDASAGATADEGATR